MSILAQLDRESGRKTNFGPSEADRVEWTSNNADAAHVFSGHFAVGRKMASIIRAAQQSGDGECVTDAANALQGISETIKAKLESWTPQPPATSSNCFRARTLSLADDPSYAAARLVECRRNREAELTKFNRALSYQMAMRRDDQGFLDSCIRESNAQALKVAVENDIDLAAWWPGFEQVEKGH